jgi:hypothetical protein
MVPHQIEFTWNEKYTATFQKIVSKEPVFVTVFDIKPDSFDRNDLMFELGKSGSPEGCDPQNIFPIDFLNILWSSILKECDEIGLDIYGLHSY